MTKYLVMDRTHSTERKWSFSDRDGVKSFVQFIIDERMKTRGNVNKPTEDGQRKWVDDPEASLKGILTDIMVREVNDDGSMGQVYTAEGFLDSEA